MSKISARFGADTTEFEKKAFEMQRRTDYLKRALEKPSSGAGMTESLAKSNEKLAKGLNLLKGGAAAAGISMVLGKMKDFSAYAKEMGDAATEAQKSAAKWGDELKAFSDTVSGWGASALGTLAGWGRNIGDFFRDPADKAYDDVAAASEEMAKRQAEALEKSKKAHEDAAKEIPKLAKELAAVQDGVELDKLGEMGRAMTEIYRLEKERDALRKGPQNAISQKRLLEIEIELTKKKADLEKQYAAQRQKEAEEEARAAQAKADAERKAAEERARESEKAADKETSAQEELAKMAYEKLADEQKLAETIKKGKAAQEKAAKSGLASDKLEVEKLREEYERLTKSIMAAKDAQAGKADKDAKFKEIGLTRGEDGKLRRGKVIVSEEDAKRTVSARERAAREAARTGQPKSEEATILAKIEKHLQPSKD